MKTLEQQIRPHARYWDCYNDEAELYNHTGKLIKIIDSFSIEFAEWFVNNGVEFYDNTSKGNVYKYISDLKVYTIKELLEIFKKEKGL